MLAVIGVGLVVVLVLLVALGVGAVHFARWATTGHWFTPEEQRIREFTRLRNAENAARRAAGPVAKPRYVSPAEAEAEWRAEAEMNYIDYWANGGPDREDQRLFGAPWPGHQNR